MAENILRLRVESSEYDNKLKRAADGLNRYVEGCRKAGGTLEIVEKDTLDFVKAIGKMETASKTATGKLNEMKRAFVEFSMQYKEMSAAEKASPVGRALSQSLDQLKGRIKDAQKGLQDINQELSGGKFGQFGSIIDGIGQKMGINANITDLLTSKTTLLTGAIGASVAVIAKATEAWTEYNAEIAKQQQITTVTTGLKGEDADKMTAAARALTKTYGVEFRDAINAANTLMSQFGVSGNEAIQLLRDGMQGMIMGDGPKLLSMIQQFVPAFRDAGVSASQLVAVIQNSEGGIFTDQNMMAIVMGIKNIRLMTKHTSDALAQLGIDGREMSEQISNGTMTVFDALKHVSYQLQSVDSGSKTAGEVMQHVFGRQGAMAGTNLAKAIDTLNTNLSETKQQTGEVGKAYDELYQANVRLEQALQKTFGYKGWEEMATGIKTMLVASLVDVLEKVNKINEAFQNTFGVTFFDAIFNAATSALGPMGKVLQLLRDINKEKSGASGGSQVNENFEYIKGGSTKQEREDRYSKVLADINNNLASIGEEKMRTNKDGSTSFYIDTPEVQQQKRTQLLNQRTQLVMNRESLLAGNPSKQIPQPTNSISPTSPTKNKGSYTLSKPEQAMAKFDQAEKDYQQALAQAAMELKAGTITEADAKKKELSARENLWKSIGDAREIYDSPKLEEAQRNVENEIIYFGDIVRSAADAQKASEKAARELEASQKKLVDAENKLAEARKTGSATAIYKAQQEVDKLKGNGRQDTGNMYDNLKQTIQAEIKFDQMKVDENTLRTLLQTAIQNGLDSLTVDYAGLQEKIAQGIDIPNETWQKLQDEINAELDKIGVQHINIDFKTGNIAKTGKETENSWKAAASAVQSVGSALQGLEDPGSKIAGIVGQAVANIALGFAQATAASSGGGIFAWIAAIVGGMATMMSTISAIHSATGYANGGMVKGNGALARFSTGGTVQGTTYSNDQIPILANAGEVVLNAAQQSNVAQNLQENGGGKMEIVGVLTGENVVLMADRWGRRTGRGELLFGKNL